MKLLLVLTEENRKIDYKTELYNAFDFEIDCILCAEKHPPSVLQIKERNADIILLFNLFGLNLRTLTGAIAYNLIDSKIIYIINQPIKENVKCLKNNISISMFFYCYNSRVIDEIREINSEIPCVREIGDKTVADVVREVAIETKLPLSELEIYFARMKKDFPRVKAAQRYIINCVNNALNTRDIDQILYLIKIMESGDGALAYQYIGEFHRLLLILRIVQMELKYGSELFLESCSTYMELYNKYIMTLFALRRISFEMSEPLVKDAKYFLIDSKLSPFAIYMIIVDDLIGKSDDFMMKVCQVMSSVWSDDEIDIFFELQKNR